MAGDWLTTGQAAARIGVVPKTVRRFVEQGLLRSHMAGSHFRFDAAEVERFASSRQVAPGEVEHLCPAGQERRRRRR